MDKMCIADMTQLLTLGAVFVHSSDFGGGGTLMDEF